MTEPDSNAGVEADAGAGGGVEEGDGAGGGQEAAAGVLAVDAELEGVAADGGVAVAELFAVGDAEHLADQVDAGDLFGDRVFDLEAGVDLEEGDRAVGADEELDGAGADVAGFLQDGLGRRVQLGVLRLRQEGRGGFLDELLVAALEGAVAGGDDDDVAVGVGEALGLDVAGLVEVALDEAFAAAEGGDGLADGGVVELGDLFEGPGDLQAAAAAAEGGLDRDGQAVFLRERHDLFGAGDRVGGAGDQRGAGALGDVTGRHLVAQVADGLRRRADPDQARVQDRLRELGVLGKEAVSGVDGVRVRVLRGLQHLGHVEIAGRRGVTAQSERLVSRPDVQGVPVRVGVDGYAADTGVPARPGHTDSDFATVGYEYLAHDGSLLRTLRISRSPSPERASGINAPEYRPWSTPVPRLTGEPGPAAMDAPLRGGRAGSRRLVR
ncbi:hypothetical protein SNARM312S_06594 [Streptomyces narbonensis]